jgi:hypothetical protein
MSPREPISTVTGNLFVERLASCVPKVVVEKRTREEAERLMRTRELDQLIRPVAAVQHCVTGTDRTVLAPNRA